MKKMSIKQAILAKGEKAHQLILTSPIDYRGFVECYKDAYTQEQIDYLFENGLLEEYNKCGAKWENRYKDYWQFTDKGKRWRIWYTTPFWQFIKYYVFPVFVIKIWWQRFMIRVFNKHYDWQDYIGVDLNDI